jgi:hypothetical protein
MNKKHSQNSGLAKERKRLSSPPPDYFNAPDYTTPARKIIIEDSHSRHEFLLFISPDRIDQFRVIVDGKPWLERAGMSRILAGLRKALGRFSKLTSG